MNPSGSKWLMFSNPRIYRPVTHIVASRQLCKIAKLFSSEKV